MQVTLTRDYSCAPEGHTIVQYKAGDVLEGRAAILAISDGAAKQAPKAAPAKPRKRTPRPSVTKPDAPIEQG